MPRCFAHFKRPVARQWNTVAETVDNTEQQIIMKSLSPTWTRRQPLRQPSPLSGFCFRHVWEAVAPRGLFLKSPPSDRGWTPLLRHRYEAPRCDSQSAAVCGTSTLSGSAKRNSLLVASKVRTRHGGSQDGQKTLSSEMLKNMYKH